MMTFLPNTVVESIQSHLRDRCVRGEEGWESAQEDEDTLTGDLFSCLRTDSWVDVGDANGGRWKFRVNYKKFRGRGPGAEESIIGADGIVEITVDDCDRNHKLRKGLLFQAKKIDNRDARSLGEQAQRMEEAAPGGSAVIVYGPNEYRGIDAAQVITNSAMRVLVDKGQRLGDYLADRFLGCYVGKMGLQYDAVGQRVLYPDPIGGIVSYRTKLTHRLRIETVGE